MIALHSHLRFSNLTRWCNKTWSCERVSRVINAEKRKCRIIPRRDKRTTLAPKEREGCSSKARKAGNAEGCSTGWRWGSRLAAVLQLHPQSGRGWRGSKPPEWLHHIAPRITRWCRTWAQLKEVTHGPREESSRPESWRFRVRFGQNTRLPTAGTETPFSLKLYFFHFRFCNIASSLILLSFPLLAFRLFLIYIYIIFSRLFFLFSYFTKWETEWWTANNIYNNFPLPNINRCLLTRGWIFFVCCKQSGWSASGVPLLRLRSLASSPPPSLQEGPDLFGGAVIV